jgi:hypothetical protein
LRENVTTDFNVESGCGRGMKATIAFTYKTPLSRPN